MLRFCFTILLHALAISMVAQIDNPVLIKAGYEFEMQNYDKAIKLYTSLIKSDISKTESLVKRGESLLLVGLVNEAILDFKEAEKLQENSASILLASAYAYLNKTEQAIYWLDKHLQAHDKLSINEVKNYSYFSKIQNDKQWIDLWKKEWYSKYDLSLSHANYLFVNGNSIEALDELDILIDKKPRMDEAYILRTQVYNSIGQYKLALSDCDNAIKFARKNADYYCIRSDVYISLNKLNKALSDINYAVSIENNNIKLYKHRAKIFIELNDHEKAKADMELYLSFCYNDISALYNMGLIYYNLDDYLNALLSFNKCLELKPSNFKSYVARGDTYFKTKTYKYAERDYAMALDLNPKDGNLYYKRALVRKALHNQTGVCSDLKKAIKFGVYEAEEMYYRICK